MNKSQYTKLEKLKAKLSCSLVECKDSFVFEVLDTELEYIDKEKIKYVGKCSRCAASLKLNAKSLQFFSQFVGKPNITIRKSKYQELFDSNE